MEFLEDLTLTFHKFSTRTKEFWRRFKKNQGAMAGLVILCVIFFCAIFANVIADESLIVKQNARIRLQGPSSAHLFGTDVYGRDIFTRVIFGSRISLTIGIVAALNALLLGGSLGAVAAFYGKRVDEIIMRIMDMLMAIPTTLLALSIVAALGSSMTNLLIAISLSSMPSFARLVRSSILSVVEMEYVEAARACGTGDLRIILKDILPNAIGPIIVQTTQSISGMILTASSLSFIGMGVQAPQPEWGALLSEAREYMRTYPYMIISPGIFIILTALSFNLLGDGLRDALDPRLKD
ncbi:MAG: ABC transporter permease [Synergistaceae bacterium]|nr:ABC transporter permease [Synergistaceae bacterium]